MMDDWLEKIYKELDWISLALVIIAVCQIVQCAKVLC